MSFLNKLLEETRKNYRYKLMKKRIQNYNKKSSRSLTLNDVPIHNWFIKINNEDEKEKYMYCSNFQDYKLCYLLTWQTSLDLSKFINPIDLVVCDINWKIVKLYKSLQKDYEFKFKQNSHIYVMCQNSINSNDMKIGDYLKPF